MNTQDQELIEMAAKACGMTVSEALSRVGKPVSLYSQWNPLEDDGDAFRLAVALELNVFHAAGNAYALLSDFDFEAEVEEIVSYRDAGGVNNATRRAIVRAAAAIGEQLEGNV